MFERRSFRLPCRTRARGIANNLSVMIWDRTRRPLLSVASMIGLMANFSTTSDVIGHASTVVVVSPNSSAWTITAGRGLPSSPYATIMTSPRFTAIRSCRRWPQSTHRSGHSLDAALVICLGAEDRRVRADPADRAPNAAPAAVLARASRLRRALIALARSSDVIASLPAFTNLGSFRNMLRASP